MDKAVAVITGGQGDLASTVASQLEKAGYETLSPSHAALDVVSGESVTAFFSALDSLDLLINCAGITRDGPFVRQTPDDWGPVIDTNLKGAQLCSQAAAGIMAKQRSGHIINIGSYSASHPPPGQTAYAASKAGLEALTKSYAKEYGKRNLRSNCVLPGFLESNMTESLSEAAVQAALARHQLGRFNTCDEAAKFICFLASTKHISGQIFQLDSRT